MPDALGIHSRKAQILLRDLERNVLLYGGKSARKVRDLAARGESLAQLAFDLTRMIEHFIKRFVLFKQGFCGFLPDTRHSRDVVARVSAQGFEVDVTLRSEAVGGEFREVDDLHVAHALLRPEYPCGGADQLEAVAVAREDDRVLVGHHRKRAEDVVRLVTLLAHHGHAHEFEQLFKRLELFRKLGVHGLSCAFIWGVQLVAESGRFEVECRRDVRRGQLFDYAQKNGQKTVYRARVHTLRCLEIGQGVIGAMYYAVCVDKKQRLFVHISLRGCRFRLGDDAHGVGVTQLL